MQSQGMNRLIIIYRAGHDLRVTGKNAIQDTGFQSLPFVYKNVKHFRCIKCHVKVMARIKFSSKGHA